MKFIQRVYSACTRTLFLLLGVGGFIGSVQASFDSDFVHKYTELNLGNWGYANYTFPDSNDRVNAFNRSVNINIPIGKTYKVGANFSTQMNLKYGSNIWQWSDVGGVVSATPRSNFFNAGLGFNLGFGRLIAPADNPYGMWVYESEAGKIIRFYDNFSGETPVANVFYSHESQKLRLKVVSSTQMTVEFTNGHIHEFRKQEGNWEIFKRSDQFGNYQQFTYNYTQNRVTTSDNHGRIQWIHFKADPSGYFPRVIDKIRVTKPVSGVATHTFNYSTLSISTPSEDNSSATPATITVPILTSITHPSAESIIFDYYGNADVGAGRLKNYTNKFGGRVRWVYANIDMPLVQNPANLNQSLDHFAADVVGVTLRRAVDDVAGGILGDWTFSVQWKDGARNAAPSLSQPTGMISSMIRPDGFNEERYFKVLIKDVTITSPITKTSDKSEYGYPGLVNDWGEERVSSVDTWTTHTRVSSSFACVNCIDPDPDMTNHVKNDTGGHIRRNLFYSRNWAGQAADVRHLDNGTLIRTTAYDYTSSKPAVSSLWIAKPATKKTVTEGAYSKISESCVNSFGQITRQRQVRGASQASNDFIQEIKYDTSGNLVEGNYFGGDSQAVANGSLCSIALPTPQYRKYTNWSKGSISGKGFLTATGAIASETLVNTIDANTGLLTSFHSGDGLAQTIGYDTNMRPTSIAFPVGQGGKHTIVYSARSGANYATKTSTNTSEDGLTTFSQTVKKYDSFGRVIETKKLGPAGWAVYSNAYDGMGHKISHTDAYGAVTQYLNFDYKGRHTIKRPPEGAAHDVVYTYNGDKKTTYRVSIGKNPSAFPPVELFRTTTSERDIFGREILSQTTDEDGFVQTRSTTFDLNGKWKTKTKDGVTINNSKQYDALGRMVVDNYGSAHSYNSIGKPLVQYSTYGDQIDLVYDAAGRLVAKNSGGLNYITYQYATANSPGEYNKGRLTQASRKNYNVEDIFATVTVTDNFEYKGKGGRRSKRTTSIDSPAGNIIQSESSVILDDALNPLSLTTPSCIGSSMMQCPSFTETYQYGYDLGKVTTISVDGSSLMSGVQYNVAGQATDYHFANGLDTELLYTSNSSEPSQLIIKKAGVQQWNSGVAISDGNQVVSHFGVNQELPIQYYDLSDSQLPSTSASRPVKPDNGVIDRLGLTENEISECKGNQVLSYLSYCETINVYNANNQVVWKRIRANTWSTSFEGPNDSELLFADVLGRRGYIIEGYGLYSFTSRFRTQTLLNSSVSVTPTSDVFMGQGKTKIGERAVLPARMNKYFHSNLSTKSYIGGSDRFGVFTEKVFEN